MAADVPGLKVNLGNQIRPAQKAKNLRNVLHVAGARRFVCGVRRSVPERGGRTPFSYGSDRRDGRRRSDLWCAGRLRLLTFRGYVIVSEEPGGGRCRPSAGCPVGCPPGAMGFALGGLLRIPFHHQHDCFHVSAHMQSALDVPPGHRLRSASMHKLRL